MLQGLTHMMYLLHFFIALKADIKSKRRRFRCCQIKNCSYRLGKKLSNLVNDHVVKNTKFNTLRTKVIKSD